MWTRAAAGEAVGLRACRKHRCCHLPPLAQCCPCTLACDLQMRLARFL